MPTVSICVSPGRGAVLIGGARADIVTVAMDSLTVDVTAIVADPGDDVVILGEQAGARITATDVASAIGTVPHEVLCRIGARIERHTIRDGDRPAPDPVRLPVVRQPVAQVVRPLQRMRRLELVGRGAGGARRRRGPGTLRRRRRSEAGRGAALRRGGCRAGGALHERLRRVRPGAGRRHRRRLGGAGGGRAWIGSPRCCCSRPARWPPPSARCSTPRARNRSGR